MSATMIEILSVVGYILLGGLGFYLKTKEILNEKATGAITDAEETYKDSVNAGDIKFEYAVDKLYSYVPAALRVFITRDVLNDIVQSAFDNLEAYAKTQIEKLTKAV